MDIWLGLRNENHTPEELKNYDVFDLVNKLDCILAEHGFARRYRGVDEKYGHSFSTYEGVRGSVMVRFVNRGDGLIPLIIDGELKANCPVYINLKNVPQNVVDSIKRDAREI